MMLQQIYRYPIKSMEGNSLKECLVTPRGLAFDRHWALFDENGQVITARQFPVLLNIQPQWTASGLCLEHASLPPLSIPFTAENKAQRKVYVFDGEASGLEVSEEASQWFTQLLGQSCRLIFMDAQSHRPVLPKYGGRLGDEVSYADECPLLLISEASLYDLNTRLPSPMEMRPFRPNLVVEGSAPYEEDTWKLLRIGSCIFEVAQPCKRCVMITLDPVTGQKHPHQEPLRTLATYRKHPSGGTSFGVHLVPRSEGSIRQGDKIVILQTHHPS